MDLSNMETIMDVTQIDTSEVASFDEPQKEGLELQGAGTEKTGHGKIFATANPWAIGIVHKAKFFKATGCCTCGGCCSCSFAMCGEKCDVNSRKYHYIRENSIERNDPICIPCLACSEWGPVRDCTTVHYFDRWEKHCMCCEPQYYATSPRLCGCCCSLESCCGQTVWATGDADSAICRLCCSSMWLNSLADGEAYATALNMAIKTAAKGQRLQRMS